MTITENIFSILTFCGLFGIIVLCIVLIFYAVLKWINPESPEKRMKRINLLAILAFAVLFILSAKYFTRNNDSPMTLFQIVKAIIGGLFLGIIFSLAAMLPFLIIWYIKTGISSPGAPNRTSNSRDSDKQNSNDNGNPTANEHVRNSFMAPAIACGIVSLFLVLPLLVGEQDKGSVLQTWKNGVKALETFDFNTNDNTTTLLSTITTWGIKIFNINEIIPDIENAADSQESANNEKNSLSTSFVSYILLYIIVLGVGFFIVKLLCTFITQALQNKKQDSLLDAYSTPIALLAVGVCILFKFQRGEFQNIGERELVIELFKTFALVILIAAITILSLEIVRLLLDVKDNFIRKEAKYLFISLIGQASLLLLGLLQFVFDTINVSIGNITDVKGLKIDEYLQEKIIWTMFDTADKDNDSNNEKASAFDVFDEQITKK